MSHTKISKVPYEGIRDTLEFLNLEETRNLKRYTAYRGDLDDEYKGRTFPLLEEVSFYYHAHCCQMRDHTYLEPDHQLGRREEAIRSVEQAQGKPAWQVRRARQASSIGSEGITCVNTSSGEVIGNTSVTGAEILTVDEFCSQAAYCNITAICPSGCSDVILFGSGLGSGESHSEIVCVTPNPSACYSPDTFTSQLQGSLCSPSPTLSIAPTPTPSPTCDVVCKNVVPCPSATTSAVAASPSLSPSPSLSLSPSPSMPPLGVCDPGYCDQVPEQREFCGDCRTGVLCIINRPGCDHTFLGICDCAPLFRKREVPKVSPDKVRGQIRRHSREKRSTATETTQPPEDWFFLPNSTDIICSLITPTISTTTTTLLPSPSPSPTVLPEVTCSPPGGFNPAFGVLSDDPTSCHPQPNDFNPCEDLLGDTDPAGTTLRVAIWVVIFLALFGNGLVIAVIVGYNFIVRRNKQENFIMHFLYVNLAVADFIMGVYLFTIAIVDLDTLGHYSEEAIEWQTGPGCGFAGFCAITSTMVSVFTLVVITMERVYTFVNVFSRKKVNRYFVIVVMVFGWLFGITMGMLPLIGISSYSRVAVCLPFDVSETSAQSYVASLLIITGLAFVLILFGYIIIGYQVFCSPSKRRLHNSVDDKRRYKSELMIGFRMSLLVVTNFVCWFPIALMALTAAFGESLIDISTAKFFIVFVFPVNACLNPILYSIWGKKFRENLLILIGKCGVCKDYATRLQSERRGFYTPSTSSQSVPSSRRPSMLQRLVSVSSLGVTIGYSANGRRGSAMSQGSLDYNRRNSNFSCGSDDQLLAFRLQTARRNSNLSSSSQEDTASTATTIQNVVYRSSSPVSTQFIGVGAAGEKDGGGKTRQKVSASSLGALPEIDELEIAPTPTHESSVKVNPAYLDENEEGYFSENKDIEQKPISERHHRNGTIEPLYRQHQIVADSLPDSGATSESPDSDKAVEIGNDFVSNFKLMQGVIADSFPDVMEGDCEAADEDEPVKVTVIDTAETTSD